jgi:hypothetical protein
MQYQSSSRSPADPEYPPPGVTIDYTLADRVDGAMQLEIVSQSGTVIRTFGPGDAETAERPGQGMRGPYGARRPPAQLERAPGIHRFVWDMRYPGPVDPRTGEADRSGPVAAPGQYQARLVIGDWSAARDFEILIDPRVAADGVSEQDLVEQLRVALAVRDLMSASASTLARVRSARSAPDLSAGTRETLRRLEAELATADDTAYPQPMLVDQIRYLYGMLTRAAQPPGSEAPIRLAQLGEWHARIVARLDAAVGGGGGR